MNTDDRLPLDLTWQPDGHATEVALSMLADGESELLVDEVESHVDGCDVCSARLGDAALLSLRATEELPAIAATVSVPVFMPLGPVARPIPVRAIAAALVMAIVGATPSFVTGIPKGMDFMRSVVRMLPTLGRSAISLLQGNAANAAGITPAASWLAALLFLIAGLALARTMSRARSIEGELG